MVSPKMMEGRGIDQNLKGKIIPKSIHS